jgi:hypothetical protein
MTFQFPVLWDLVATTCKSGIFWVFVGGCKLNFFGESHRKKRNKNEYEAQRRD